MGNNSADQFFPRTARSHTRNSSGTTHRRSSRARMPSSAGYMIAAITAAVALFFALWWMLVSGGDEAPWVPAGLAASVVLLVALSAREVVMRRAWTRYLLEQGIQAHSSGASVNRHSGQRKSYASAVNSAALRAIQKRSTEADAAASPDFHLEVFQLCQSYLASADEALRTNSLPGEKRIAIRSGQERVRALEKHHLLTWARDTSRSFTHEAQQRARTSDKIETANRALDCLDSALRFFPDEPELKASKQVISEFIGSIKVAHWVELAERSAFKGHLRRAIERYKDALFYLERETVKEETRLASADRIRCEIESLQARLKSARQPREDNAPR
jgi:hypothetical protein